MQAAEPRGHCSRDVGWDSYDHLESRSGSYFFSTARRLLHGWSRLESRSQIGEPNFNQAVDLNRLLDHATKPPGPTHSPIIATSSVRRLN